jgi:hypothetical protein
MSRDAQQDHMRVQTDEDGGPEHATQFEGEPAEYLKAVLDRQWERLTGSVDDEE